MKAVCLIREQPHYRRDAFVRGLQRAGYTLESRGTPDNADDLLVIWNRYGAGEAMADAWEAHGGTVLVAENGYVGADDEGRQFYALAAHGHNGSGWWPRGSPDRFAALCLDVADWVKRPEGYALVCGQRGIGSRTMASPQNWHVDAARLVDPPVKLRLHPGNKPKPDAPTINEDLAGARVCVIWSSSSGVKALLRGVPVIYDAPHWVCEGAGIPLRQLKMFDLPSPDALTEMRALALSDMAWAQWSVAELETGKPFALFRDAARAGDIKW